MTWSPEELVEQLRYPTMAGQPEALAMMRGAADMIGRQQGKTDLLRAAIEGNQP